MWRAPSRHRLPRPAAGRLCGCGCCPHYRLCSQPGVREASVEVVVGYICGCSSHCDLGVGGKVWKVWNTYRLCSQPRDGEVWTCGCVGCYCTSCLGPFCCSHLSVLLSPGHCSQGLLGRHNALLVQPLHHDAPPRLLKHAQVGAAGIEEVVQHLGRVKRRVKGEKGQSALLTGIK